MTNPALPTKHIAVVACMDARLDPSAVLGISLGEAHVVRNAGGVVTDDVIRSLAISQRVLQTTEIVLVHHTDCGMSKLSDADLAEQLRGTGGEAFEAPTYAFADAADSVRASAKVLQESPFVPSSTAITGYVWDVDSGSLDEVAL